MRVRKLEKYQLRVIAGTPTLVNDVFIDKAGFQHSNSANNK